MGKPVVIFREVNCCVSCFAKPVLLLLLAFLYLPVARANPSSMNVMLFQSRPRIDSVFVRAPFMIVNPIRSVFKEGLYECTDAGNSVRLRKAGGRNQKEIIRAPYLVLSGRGGNTIEIGPDSAHMRKYYGQMNMRRANAKGKNSAGLEVLNQVDTFNYVASVVGGETTPVFGKEALKAQAVLVYTRLSPKGRHPTVTDTTDEMVYLGEQHERPEVIDAVHEIDRRRLMFQDRPAQAFFHACCAGRTSKGSDIFGENARSMTYLQSVSCNHCKGSPLYGTTVKEIPTSVFAREIADREPRVLKLDRANRPVSAEIQKGARKEVLSGYQLWLRIGQKLGWDKAPGTRYQVKQTAGGYTIRSSGGGHGVGLCQWGAQGLSKQKKTYVEILQYYFPGTTVEQRQ
ncbi:MAG: hypothetical protein C0469_05070 [Cyanobacteria bacterium DS2.3.42]|nr:hypothetical protein [Cyanobacteria bacterium DS2.3.42]